MKGRETHRVAGLALELVPAALLNFAVAFAIGTAARLGGHADLAAAASIAGGITAFLCAWYLLRRSGSPAGAFAIARFEQCDLAADPPCIVEPHSRLTEIPSDGRDEGMQQPAADELLLDDIVERIGPDSRVVQLFDPKRMPTPGELRARIDRHLVAGTVQPPPPDATQALHQAIEELRRSLR